MVESQPSKLLVASSILVSRSIFSIRLEVPVRRILPTPAFQSAGISVLIMSQEPLCRQNLSRKSIL
jgi:hypothetical protein